METAADGRADDPLVHLALGKARLAWSEELWSAADPSGQALLGEARKAFLRSLELEPYLTEAAVGLGRTHVLAEVYQPDAEELLKRAWKRRPARAEIPVTLALMALRRASERVGAKKVLAHAASFAPRPLLERLIQEAVWFAGPGISSEAPHARAVEQAMRMIRSLRSGSGGPDLAAKLGAEDAEMTRLNRTLDQAVGYLQALRAVKDQDPRLPRESLEAIASDGESPFANAAKAILAGIEQLRTSGP